MSTVFSRISGNKALVGEMIDLLQKYGVHPVAVMVNTITFEGVPFRGVQIPLVLIEDMEKPVMINTEQEVNSERSENQSNGD